ncbi:hypothetical protein CAOG_03657 [Capsaspora owczarzaki ATCC 30864]|uniref:Mitochondrial pyruvate carrier n=1 Tax=Capsaspora owczarzaki (strain ATCC 30864) TaxID=595528 RepID=A0A0D2WPS6_CAPO3|nr:hypothetical protein CAOG_03657 [Capsaspora owczarzaki ATCC 30864]KJE92748.1 hypothetical protein CAOG_003657 [Capsaspora owczarzaki ATCC 30864]|eukprot:XP_004363385.1 hypothetical protein CAOG_03657 [Capsaspora owczarzaki ATCC 30864]
MAAISQLPSFLRFLRPLEGNAKLFSNAAALALEKRVPLFAKFNDVTYSAPAAKWILSIVPLIQAFSGNPPVEKIDLKQSSSLLFTGMVWAYYATLITPQNAGSRALCICNMAMASVHGYNVARRARHDLNKQ